MLRSFGVEGLRTRIRTDVARARRLAEWIDDQPRLETIAPTVFGLVSFAHVDGDDATRAVLEAITEDGGLHVLPSVVDGRVFIRVSIGQSYTTEKHVDALWGLIDGYGGTL